MIPFAKSVLAEAPPDPGVPEVTALGSELDSIREDMRNVAADSRHLLELVQPEHRASADNLISYLVLRRRDLRALQPRLTALGLSSLGRAEGDVLTSLEAVRHALRALEAYGVTRARTFDDLRSRQEALAANTEALLGPHPAERRVSIMVTMPSEAAHDYTLVRDLVRAGMDCMRINCAHDDSSAWAHMIEHLRRANKALGRSCQVAMDLGGPKLRTGPLEAGKAVIKIRPERDVLGRVSAPARVWLTGGERGRPAPSAALATVPLPRTLLVQLKVGNTLRFTDARGARRSFRILDVNADGAWAQVNRTCYLIPGTKLRREGKKGETAVGTVGRLPAREEPILVHPGDTLVIMRDAKPGRAATHDSRGRVLTPACIGCTLPEVFRDVRCGERIWFDDGRIGAVIESVQSDRVIVKIDHARARGEKLKADKGINLPDSNLHLSALTAKDIDDLDFVVGHADIVSLSFVNSAADVKLLQKHLKRLRGEKLGIIVKIETRRGFEALPEILLTALRSARCGVMIARGDLAVECGFERLAELQEEILWVCEAAHVPVIWATEVLESLAKEGVLSRAEITDAAMSERAECVMLNKGPHVCQAVRVLDDILKRMQAHLTKKRSMLRELKLARRFLQHES
jgi:pyruvate kinase